MTRVAKFTWNFAGDDVRRPSCLVNFTNVGLVSLSLNFISVVSQTLFINLIIIKIK